MITIYIHITAQEIQQRAEQETAEIGKRRLDQQGNSLLEQLIMDSEYQLLFRNYFREACVQALDKCQAYTKHRLSPTGEDDNDTTRKDEDFFATLRLPDTFSIPAANLIDRDIYNHLLACVLYRWFEFKLPQEAQIFRERSKENLRLLASHLEARTRPFCRPYRPI